MLKTSLQIKQTKRVGTPRAKINTQSPYPFILWQSEILQDVLLANFALVMNIAEIQLTLNNNQTIKRIRKFESVRSGGFQENNRTYTRTKVSVFFFRHYSTDLNNNKILNNEIELDVSLLISFCPSIQWCKLKKTFILRFDSVYK